MTKSRTFVLIAALSFLVSRYFAGADLIGANCQSNRARNANCASQTNEAQNDRLAKIEQQIADAKSSADNAWMLTSSALVLMMTGPGLALFYGGLVRKKNVLATMMQSFAMMAIVTTRGPSSDTRWLSATEAVLSAAFTTSFCEAWEQRPTPRMPLPFRRRHSWSIS